MLISLIMQIAQSMQISIRHFLIPQTMHITFPLKNLAVKNISGLTHCRYSSGKWTIVIAQMASINTLLQYADFYDVLCPQFLELC